MIISRACSGLNSPFLIPARTWMLNVSGSPSAAIAPIVIRFAA
jgi:hypothetical protein